MNNTFRITASIKVYLKKKIICLLLLQFIVVYAEAKPEWLSKTGAKSFPDKNTTYSINDFGAFKNEFVASTKAIQTAIDSCSASGGGIVTFEPGIYHTGAIFLKNNVNLHIGEGVELKALMGLEYYPEIETRVAGIVMFWPCGIINILDIENAAVSGSGTIHAQGKIHWERYWNLRHEYTPKGLRWASDYDCKRVRTIQVVNSKNITIKDISIKQSGFWTVHLLFSSNITVDGITIRNNIEGKGPSTDGINVDSSSLVEIMNCDVDGNDDNYCVKAGRDADGLRINKPAEFVYIHDCIARQGGGLLVIGSETSGWIRNVYAENMKAIGSANILYLKSAKTRGGGIENIELNKVSGSAVRNFCGVTVNWNPAYSYAKIDKNRTDIPKHWKIMLEEVPEKKGIPKIRNVKVSNCSIDSVNTVFNVQGIEQSIIESFQFTNIKVTASETGLFEWARDWKFKNVVIYSTNGEKPSIKNSVDIEYNNLNISKIK